MFKSGLSETDIS